MKISENNNLRYTEKKDNLTIRIDAHKKYSNFSLEEWMLKELPFVSGNIILDIGCGNGNFFPVYANKLGNKGAIVGIDQSSELLAKANVSDHGVPAVLMRGDMNQPLAFVDHSFDYVISTFAIYYVDNVRQILSDIRRVLKPGGEILLIGPTDNNARELYEFNRLLFGINRDEKITQRTNRLEKEFFPALGEFFQQTSSAIIPSRIEFPDRQEFIRYYLATLLFEESAAKTGTNFTKEEIEAFGYEFRQISKEMIFLRGKKIE